MSDHDPLCPIFGVDDEAIAEDSTILYDCACALIARVRADERKRIAEENNAEEQEALELAAMKPEDYL